MSSPSKMTLKDGPYGLSNRIKYLTQAVKERRQCLKTHLFLAVALEQAGKNEEALKVRCDIRGNIDPLNKRNLTSIALLETNLGKPLSSLNVSDEADDSEFLSSLRKLKPRELIQMSHRARQEEDWISYQQVMQLVIEKKKGNIHDNIQFALWLAFAYVQNSEHEKAQQIYDLLNEDINASEQLPVSEMDCRSLSENNLNEFTFEQLFILIKKLYNLKSGHAQNMALLLKDRMDQGYFKKNSERLRELMHLFRVVRLKKESQSIRNELAHAH